MTGPGRARSPPASPSGFLTDMVRAVRREVREGYYRMAAPSRPTRAHEGRFARSPFSRAVREGRTDPALLVEYKRVSPGYARGRLPLTEPDRFLRHAIEGGASALSVIPQPHAFGGSLRSVDAIAHGSALPVLFKDFVIDVVQIDAAGRLGASAVLFLARLETEGLLGRGRTLAPLLRAAHDRGLESLVEVHAASELATARASEATLLGVNARDLQTLQLDPRSSLPLLRDLRADGRPLVAMSGVKGPAEVRRYRAAGASAVLIGTSFARARDPAAFLRGLAPPRRPTLERPRRPPSGRGGWHARRT